MTTADALAAALDVVERAFMPAYRCDCCGACPAWPEDGAMDPATGHVPTRWLCAEHSRDMELPDEGDEA